ncbi:MAG: hypothetical protein ACOC0J_01290 [Myxococcota bacterium]
MTNKMRTVVGALVLLACFVAGCGGVDSELVGVWECTETSSPTNWEGRLLKLTEDGEMGTADAGVSHDEIEASFEYEASGGEMTYWFPEHPDDSHTVSYSIEGDVLDIPSTGGLQGTWQRVE